MSLGPIKEDCIIAPVVKVTFGSTLNTLTALVDALHYDYHTNTNGLFQQQVMPSPLIFSL
jgi:hypothetical protein